MRSKGPPISRFEPTHGAKAPFSSRFGFCHRTQPPPFFFFFFFFYFLQLQPKWIAAEEISQIKWILRNECQRRWERRKGISQLTHGKKHNHVIMTEDQESFFLVFFGWIRNVFKSHQTSTRWINGDLKSPKKKVKQPRSIIFMRKLISTITSWTKKKAFLHPAKEICDLFPANKAKNKTKSSSYQLFPLLWSTTLKKGRERGIF